MNKITIIHCMKCTECHYPVWQYIHLNSDFSLLTALPEEKKKKNTQKNNNVCCYIIISEVIKHFLFF